MSPSAAPDRAGPANDAKLTEFLQKRLRIPNPGLIKLGTPVASPITGLWSRSVDVTAPQGGSASLTLFSDASGSKFILGHEMDITQDPWGRLDISGLHLDDRPALGPADAPITIVEFADFECPFCARALTSMETAVHTTHKGQLRLIFKNFPLNSHPWARTAALAAECARLQNPDAFWDFASDFYQNQSTIDADNIEQQVDSFSSGARLDSKALHACMAGRAAHERLEQDLKDGLSVHVGSTPTFLVNGIPLMGTPDPSILDFVIASELRSPGAAH